MTGRDEVGGLVSNDSRDGIVSTDPLVPFFVEFLSSS